MRTIFNILGPLTNPAGADAQVLGVYDENLVPLVANALARMDVERAMVVHGSGLDEITVHDETTVAEVSGSSIEEYALHPSDVGLERHEIGSIAGGTPAENATDMRAIVEGSVDGAKRDVILANAGAAIYVAGEATSHRDGVERARQAIESGDAAAKLDDLRGAGA